MSKENKNPKLNTPEGRKSFAQESAEQATAVPPSQALALFTEGTALDEYRNVTRRNLPQMIKPEEVPVGSAVTGEIVKIVNSPVSTIKGKLLWMRHKNGTEFLFPCTGVIRSALAPGVTNDEDDKLVKALEKEVGKIMVAQRLADKVTTKFDKKGKRMFVFDVYTADKAK